MLSWVKMTPRVHAHNTSDPIPPVLLVLPPVPSLFFPFSSQFKRHHEKEFYSQIGHKTNITVTTYHATPRNPAPSCFSVHAFNSGKLFHMHIHSDPAPVIYKTKKKLYLAQTNHPGACPV